MFEVRLKAGHPTGTYHRAGLVFHAGEATRLEKLPKDVKEDAWLTVTQSKGSSAVPTLEDYVKAGYKAENYEMHFFGLKPRDEYDEDLVDQNLLKAGHYDQFGSPDLVAEAKKRGIEIPTSPKKQDVIALLQKYDAEHK